MYAYQASINYIRCHLHLAWDVFGFIYCYEVSDTDLDFFFAFFAVCYDATPPHFIDDGCTLWQYTERESSKFVKLQNQTEIGGRTRNFLIARLYRFQPFATVMLITFIIKDLINLEILFQIQRPLNRHLYGPALHYIVWFIPNPVIHTILNVADTISVANDFIISRWLIFLYLV